MSTSTARITAPAALGWSRLLVIVSTVVGIAGVLHGFLILRFPLAGIIGGILFLGTAWLVRWRTRRLTIALAGAAHLFELTNLLFVYGGPEALSNPSAWQDFLINGFFILATLVGTVTAAAAWRAETRR